MNINKKSILNIFSVFILIFAIQLNTKSANLIDNEDILIKVNGIVDTKNSFNKHSSKQENNSIILKLTAKTKQKNNISTFGKIEEIINTNNSSNKKKKKKTSTKLVYLGIKHKNLGEIKLGKNKSVIYNTLLYTDISPYYKSKIYKNNSLTGINSNTITYKKKIKLNNKNNIFKNITLISQYQDKSNNFNKNIYQIKNGWGIGYNIKTNYGIEIASSYANQKTKKEYQLSYSNNTLNKLKNSFSSAWSTSIKYNLNKLYIAYSYLEGNNLNLIKNIASSKEYNKYKFVTKTQNINLVAKYNFDSGFTPILGYTQTTLKNLDKIKYHKKSSYYEDTEKYFNIGATYNFNKSFSSYIDYKIDQLPNNNFNNIIIDNNIDNNNNNNNNLTLGFIYKF